MSSDYCSDDYDMILPEYISRYSILFKAKKKDGKEYYFIKTILCEINAESLSNEISVLKSINSHFLLKTYDQIPIYYTDNTYEGIVTEYCSKGNLRQLISYSIENQIPIPTSTITYILYCLISGLKDLHSMGLANKDLKPENIFISEANEFKMGDFGITKALPDNRAISIGSVPSTLLYNAPEFLLNNQETSQNKYDVWSLGCILYELCCLKQMFKSPLEVLEKKATDFSEVNEIFRPTIEICICSNASRRISIKELYEYLCHNIFPKYLPQLINLLKEQDNDLPMERTVNTVIFRNSEFELKKNDYLEDNISDSEYNEVFRNSNNFSELRQKNDELTKENESLFNQTKELSKSNLENQLLVSQLTIQLNSITASANNTSNYKMRFGSVSSKIFPSLSNQLPPSFPAKEFSIVFRAKENGYNLKVFQHLCFVTKRKSTLFLFKIKNNYILIYSGQGLLQIDSYDNYSLLDTEALVYIFKNKQWLTFNIITPFSAIHFNKRKLLICGKPEKPDVELGFGKNSIEGFFRKESVFNIPWKEICELEGSLFHSYYYAQIDDIEVFTENE